MTDVRPSGKLSRGARAHFQPARVARAGEQSWLPEALGDRVLSEVSESLGSWELEIGFGKGRYLLRRAVAEPEARLMGIELVSQYFKLAADRARRKRCDRLVLLQGEALFLLATWLPPSFAHTIHVYFPDPWPKAKHHRRRLFDEETVDLLLRALTPDGRLLFASDHPEYGQRVLEVLSSHSGLEVRRIDDVWPDGARTNYEAKYIEEGRPILRLEARPVAARGRGEALLHPAGRTDLLVAAPRPVEDADTEAG